MQIRTIEETYANIMNRILMFRWVNAGQSSVSNIQDKLVQETFDMAYNLLEYYHSKDKKEDFRLLYRNIMEIVPGPEMKPFMKHPEMYDSMVASKQDFIKKTAHMIVKMNALSTYMQNKMKSKEIGQ